MRSADMAHLLCAARAAISTTLRTRGFARRFASGWHDRLRRYAAACHVHVEPGTLGRAPGVRTPPRGVGARGARARRSRQGLHRGQRIRTLGRRDVGQHRHRNPMTARWQTGTVASGGEEIYYEVSGDDDLPAIMLTHGIGGTHAAWFQQVPTLAANGFRVITWDCRGFGNSTFTSGVHGSAAAVADMAAVLDATGTPGAHLVGQSMGGWSVTAFTVAHPARTHSLTLLNTVGGLWTTALLDYFREWTTKAAANFGAEQRI